jgi:hypothetical protein
MCERRRVLLVAAVFVAAASGCVWGGAVRDASAQIAVTTADPPTGEQGTFNLSLKITGKGFKARSSVCNLGAFDVPFVMTVK